MTTSLVTTELHPWNDDSRSGITGTSVLGGLVSNRMWGGDRDYVTLIKYINANPGLKSYIEQRAKDDKWEIDRGNYKQLLKDAPKYKTLENVKQGAELATTVLSFVDLGAGLLASQKTILFLPKSMTAELETYQAAAKSWDLIKISTKGTTSNARSVWEATTGRKVPDGYDVDHIIQRQFSGTDEFGNIQLKPSGLNRSEGAKAYQLNKNIPNVTKFNDVKVSE